MAMSKGSGSFLRVVRSEHYLYPDAPQCSPAGEQRGQVLSSIPEETVDSETCKSYPT